MMYRTLALGNRGFAWTLLFAGTVIAAGNAGAQQSGAATPENFLVREGKSAFQIVLQPGASPSEQFAAEELRAHFQACSGVNLPVVTERPAEGTPMIVLGCGPLATQLGLNPTPEELGEQGYWMRAAAPNLVIAGSPMAGTLYGVYDFLQESLGVRWYAPGVTKTPAITELRLPDIDRRYHAPFAWRNTSYAWPGGDAAFRARMRINNGGGGADNPEGIQYSFDGICHTYFQFISPGEFFDTHPEYFSEIGGVRRNLETQLCLTNPDVLEIVAERMLERMAKNPGARQHNFSQMDYYNACECPKCREINEKYGSGGGTQFWFINQLAERTAKVYPGKLIGTLAYMYTEEPPNNLEMHPNTAVWLCHMFPCCDSHPIASCPLNADYKRRAEAWSKICKHLYIWHYIVDFAHYYNPFPNFGAMAADIRFYRDIGVEGMFLQGMGHGGGGGEFSLLRPYYGMQLLWNPDQDPDALMRDFLDGYYGPAGKPIREYIALLQNKVDTENIHMHLYTNPAQGYLTDEIMDQAKALFDQAEAAVDGDADLLERVKVARMPLTYARTFPRNGYTIAQEKLVFTGPFASLMEIGEIGQRMQQHGFAAIREQSGDPSQLAMLGMAMNMPMDAPAIQNEHLTITTAPFLGGRALQIIDKASGNGITANNVTRCLFFPFAGGEETRLDGITSMAGIFEQYSVAEKTPEAITLVAKSGPYEIRRSIALIPGEPRATIATRVTNATDKPQEVVVRSHLELDLGELQQTQVAFTNRLGESIQRAMAPIIAGMREGEHYLDQKAPKDVWRFRGSKGLELTQRFDDAELDFAWLYAYPDYLNELEVELWSHRTPLLPGESYTFEHSLEVRPAQ